MFATATAATAAAATAGASAVAASSSAAAVPSRFARVQLYRTLLRTAANFHDYNFRAYAQRRIKEKFREHQHEQNPAALSALYAHAHKDLKMLRRQALIGQLYSTGHNILEGREVTPPSEAQLFQSAFALKSAPAPAESFRQWLAEAAVEEPAQPAPADKALPLRQAQEREPGQGTRTVADNKGQHSGPAKLEGYES